MTDERNTVAATFIITPVIFIPSLSKNPYPLAEDTTAIKIAPENVDKLFILFTSKKIPGHR